MNPELAQARAATYDSLRAQLTTYATRMVVRPDVAEDLVQQAAIRMLEARGVPSDPRPLRAWLFRVVSNLAIDHLRRHSTWREQLLLDAQQRAYASQDFMDFSRRLQGSQETRSIAREHLTVCFACTLRAMEPKPSAALLLKEVYGFTVPEVAAVMSCSFGQAKGWLQAARATLRERFAETCALVNKRGVCHQCVQLDQFFGAGRGDPLAGTEGELDDRVAILREERESTLGPWHREMMRLVDEVLGLTRPEQRED